MKIGDITPGTEYGALDKPTRGSYQLPRQVKAVEIVTEAKGVWVGGGFTSTRGTRNVRVIKIEMLDEPNSNARSWDTIASAKKGEVITVESRQLVGAWKDLRSDVKARIEEAQAKEDVRAAASARITALLPEKMRDEHIRVDARTGYGKKAPYASVTLDGDVLDVILGLAEKGAALDA